LIAREWGGPSKLFLRRKAQQTLPTPPSACSNRPMHGSLQHALAAVCLAASAIVAAQSSVIHPRVVVVAYFEVGSDTGDQPGELQFWVERDHLDRIIQVPGMSRTVRANADGSELAITIGPGNINPAVNLMAFAADPRFDLRQTHWLIAGIAGISPGDGTIGSAVWTDYVINGDLAKGIDPREKPASWPDGFLSLDGVTPADLPSPAWEDDVRAWSGTDARANRRGNVIRLNADLLQWAYGLTKDIALPESQPERTLRLRYAGFAGTADGPRVQIGANLATEVFWHGALLDAWARRWVQFETGGVAHFSTTAMNDTGALLALHSLTLQGKADWNRVLLLRTASNFDMPPAGVAAADNLAAERHGAYTANLSALEAAYVVGHRIVAAWLQ
jgi:purine nucleoside permease